VSCVEQVRRPRYTSALSVEVSHGPDGCRVVLDGELDVSTVHRLRTALDGARGARLVVVDLAEVGFFGVCGLTALLGAQSALAAAGGRLVLSGPRPMLRRVLRISGLDAVLTVGTDGT
jgi:anti-sigma B factor antagonist